DLMDIWHEGSPVPVWPVKLKKPDRFQAEKNLTQFVNKLDEAEFNALNSDIEKIRSGLKSQGIHNWSKLYLKKSGTLLTGFIQILIAIPALLGIVLNDIPFYAAKAIAAKQGLAIEYYTPVRMAAHFFIAIIQNAILAGFMIAGECWIGLIVLILYPVWSWFAAF